MLDFKQLTTSFIYKDYVYFRNSKHEYKKVLIGYSLLEGELIQPSEYYVANHKRIEGLSIKNDNL